MDPLKHRKPGVGMLDVIAAWLATVVVTMSGKTLTAPTINDPVVAGPWVSTAIKDSNGNVIIGLTPVASAVNYIRMVNASSSSPAIRADGGSSNVNINLQPKGTGVIRIVDSAGTIVFAAAAGVASAVNYVEATNAAATGAPRLAANGTDTNIDLDLRGKGTGVPKSNGNPLAIKVAVPANATATGVPGQWAVDANFVYFCTAANTWVRAAVATW